MHPISWQIVDEFDQSLMNTIHSLTPRWIRLIIRVILWKTVSSNSEHAFQNTLGRMLPQQKSAPGYLQSGSVLEGMVSVRLKWHGIRSGHSLCYSEVPEIPPWMISVQYGNSNVIDYIKSVFPVCVSFLKTVCYRYPIRDGIHANFGLSTVLKPIRFHRPDLTWSYSTGVIVQWY